MRNRATALLFGLLMLLGTTNGCLGDSSSDQGSASELFPSLEAPCLSPSLPVLQEETIIFVEGEERTFRLSVPSSDAGTELALIIVFHGGTDSQGTSLNRSSSISWGSRRSSSWPTRSLIRTEQRLKENGT